MKVIVRADGSRAIGSGHLMRCLALAEVLVGTGDVVTLLTRPEGMAFADRWSELGASVQLVSAKAGSARDAAEVAAVVRSQRAAWLVLDGYEFGADYRREIRADTRLLVVDDHGTSGLEAEVVVNGSLHATDALYPGTKATLLTGPRYALLRQEFRSARAPGKRQGVLVSLGGSDPNGHTAPLLDALAGRGIAGRVVVGPDQESASAVRETAQRAGWEAVEAPSLMAPLIGSSEVAIVGAGTTSVEAIAMSTPLVAVVVTDNQVPAAEHLERHGLAVVIRGEAPALAADAVAGLLGDRGRREAMAQRSHALVDGRGAIRVIAAMREPLLGLRPASIDDATLLFDWRNDSGTRSASFDSQPVSQAEHTRWLAAALASTSRTINICELEGQPVGVVRLDRHGATATVSLTVAPQFRALGIATPMIRLGLARASESGIQRVVARIRAENKVSRRAFATAGFVMKDASAASSSVVMVASTGVRD